MKIRNKILIALIIVFIIISTFFVSSSYAGIMTQEEWNAFVGDVDGTNVIQSVFGGNAVNSTPVRVLVTALRMIQVVLVGLCIITLTIAGIRYFVMATPNEKARDHGDITTILIVSALVMFVFGGGIELLLRALI